MLSESSETKRRTLPERREDRVRATRRLVEGDPSEIPCQVIELPVQRVISVRNPAYNGEVLALKSAG
jgi:hypothetical protein